MRRTLFVFLFGLIAGIAVIFVLDSGVDLGSMGDSASEVLDDAERGARHLQLEARVRTALALQKDFDLFGGIGVSAEDDTITLTGKVGSEDQQALAELIAKGVDGVGAVINELEIQSTESD
ncbi:MAG: BON domain-containing protein [Acidobacteria bacterium]|nr:BON domain-containing protein [Acidobacteriota bacterium]